MSSVSGIFDKSEVYNNVHENKSSFADILSGKNAFYKADDYVETTKRDFSVKSTLPATYVWNTQGKIMRVVKTIFSYLFFPVLLVHSLAGKHTGLLPASNLEMMGLDEGHAVRSRKNMDFDGEWKYKRFTIDVDGYQIDTVITGKASTLGNGRWVVDSNGNGEFYEYKLKDREFTQFLTGMNSNGIVFNYPGVASSSDGPSRYAMAKAYRAVLKFVEEEIQAKKIVGKGFSIGGGTQGDALNNYKLKPDIKYVFIKIKTFYDLAAAASYLTHPILGGLVKLLGWNLSSVESSKNLPVPEIVVQTAAVDEPEELKDSSKLIGDGVIANEASLAKVLLDDDSCPKHNKTFIGVYGGHNTPFDTSSLIKKAKEYLGDEA